MILLFAISQSQAKQQILIAAIELAKSKVVHSIYSVFVTRSWFFNSENDPCRILHTHAGPEIGVASTKAFTAQVTVLTLMALQNSQAKKGQTIKQFSFSYD